jgi:hypothetical protein
MWTLRLTAILTLCSGCATSGAADCGAWRPILIADADVLTVDTARAILAHNLTGRRLCGW